MEYRHRRAARRWSCRVPRGAARGALSGQAMTHAKPVFQKLSTATIDQSPEIQSWLSQFSIGNRKAAKMLLHHLKFVSRDEFSVWLRRAVGELPDSEIYALYSVRKLEK